MSGYRTRCVVYPMLLALGLAMAGTAGPLYAGAPVAKPGVPTAKSASMAPFIAETAAPAKRQGMVRAGGLNWLCQGSRCAASAAPALFGIKSCQDAAREVGKIRSFTSAKQALSAAELSQCNAEGNAGPAARIGTPAAPVPGLSSVINPSPAGGGAPAETSSPARTQAPKVPVLPPSAAAGGGFAPSTPQATHPVQPGAPQTVTPDRPTPPARFLPVSLSTAALLLEGTRFQPVSIQTHRLEITGNRFEPVAARTGELVLTGTRSVPVAFTTPPLVLEGVR